MAKQKDWNFKDITIPNAYICIDHLSGNKNSLDMLIGIYASKEAKDKDEIICQVPVNFKPSVVDTATNFYKQGYEEMNKIDLFAGSIDILEEGQTV